MCHQRPMWEAARVSNAPQQLPATTAAPLALELTALSQASVIEAMRARADRGPAQRLGARADAGRAAGPAPRYGAARAAPARPVEIEAGEGRMSAIHRPNHIRSSVCLIAGLGMGAVLMLAMPAIAGARHGGYRSSHLGRLHAALRCSELAASVARGAGADPANGPPKRRPRMPQDDSPLPPP